MYINKKNFFEKNKFEIYADDWWNLNGNLKFLHKMNPLRLQYIINCTKTLNKKKIIDIGCGGGILTESMYLQGAKVTGLDICKKLLDIAKIRSLKKKFKINYLQQTVKEHAKKFIKYYDIITCMEMLEHVHNPKKILSLCYQMLKPKGDLFISTINRNKKSYIIAIIFAEYLMNILPLGTHDIKYFIKPSELLDWAYECKLIGVDITGLKYNIFFKNFYFSSKPDINYIIHFKKY